MSTSSDGSAAPAAFRTRNWFKLLGYSITGLITLVLVIYQIEMYEPKKSGPAEQEKAMVLSMTANGDSPHVLTKSGYAVDYKGSGFVLYCVYTDKHKGMNDGRVNTCGDGPMLYQYLHDTTGDKNTVPYEYVRKN